MPAKRIFQTLKTDECIAIAKEIIATISNQTKKEGVTTHQIEVWESGHGYRPFGDNKPTDYIDFGIKVDNKEWNSLGYYDLKVIGQELTKQAEQQGYECEQNECGLFSFPCTIRAFGKPCKEFKALAKLVQTKTKGAITLLPNTLYSVRLFGKRSSYGENGERCYYAYSPSHCQNLTNLIKSYGRKRITITIDTMDDIDTRASSYYETECYGSRNVTLKVTRG